MSSNITAFLSDVCRRPSGGAGGSFRGGDEKGQLPPWVFGAPCPPHMYKFITKIPPPPHPNSLSVRIRYQQFWEEEGGGGGSLTVLNSH